MPIYTWEDSKTGKQIDVLRDHENYTTPPLREEACKGSRGNAEKEIEPVPAIFTEAEFDDALFGRIIGASIRTIRGGSWGSGKGNWLILGGLLWECLRPYMDILL